MGQQEVHEGDRKTNTVVPAGTARLQDQATQEREKKQKATPAAVPEAVPGGRGPGGGGRPGPGPGPGRPPEPPEPKPIPKPIPIPTPEPGPDPGRHPHPPTPEPGPDPGRHPHPPTPDPRPIHGGGFNPDPGRPPFRPPGGVWGGEDPVQWGRGWDPVFWQGDQNNPIWSANMNAEANYIGGLLNTGDAVNATNVLSNDLFQMRGDIYAQDELLSMVKNAEDFQNQVNPNPNGSADLFLGNWDPGIGTWDNKEIDAPGVPPGQGNSVPTYDSFGNPINDRF